MSRSFATGDGRLEGTLTAVAWPFTIGMFIKYSDFPAASHYLVSFHSDNEWGDANGLRTDNTDKINAFQSNGSGYPSATVDAPSAGAWDDEWIGIAGVFETGKVTVYADTISNTANFSHTTSQYDENPQYIEVRASPYGVDNYDAVKIAEFFIYDGIMSTADLTSFLGGTRVTSLASETNLEGYWPFDTSSLADQSTSGQGVTLTENGTITFDGSDHPIITGGGDLFVPYHARNPGKILLRM